MWSAVEVNIRIICACIPTLKPLISRVPRLFRRQKSDLSIELPSKVVEPSTNPKLTFPTTAQEIPFPVASHRENASEGVDSVQFITTPHALNMQSSFQPTPSGETLQSLDMTFIHFGNPKSMVSMSNKESFLFLFLATLLSFLSGFEYGFLNTINCRFQQAAEMGPNGMIGSNASFFAYAILGFRSIQYTNLEQGLFCGPTYLRPFNIEEMGFQIHFHCWSVYL
jgi:hypothetical protein